MMRSRQIDKGFNRLIGANIRYHRKIFDLSGKDLSKRLNISSQQLYKYEKGEDRISAESLYLIAKEFSVDVSVLYSEEKELCDIDFVNKKIDPVFCSLYKAYNNIEDKKIRRNVLNILEHLTS